MLLNPFTLHLPKTAREAASLYVRTQNLASDPVSLPQILAGGTFLLNRLKLLKTKGTTTPGNILSLARVEELKGISLNDGILTIKAMTRINEIFESPLLDGHLNILHAVCRNIATNPIRNMATIGGNLTCRYTWTEMGAVMVALEAQLHFLGPDRKEEIISAENFFKGSAHCEKLFTHVTIPSQANARSVYRRVKKTVHMDVPVLAICLKAEIKKNRWSNTRIGINNGMAFAQRDTMLEEFLNKSVSSPNLGQEALGHLTAPIYDTRSSDYKQHMFRVSIKSAINEIVGTQDLASA